MCRQTAKAGAETGERESREQSERAGEGLRGWRNKGVPNVPAAYIESPFFRFSYIFVSLVRKNPLLSPPAGHTHYRHGYQIAEGLMAGVVVSISTPAMMEHTQPVDCVDSRST